MGCEILAVRKAGTALQEHITGREQEHCKQQNHTFEKLALWVWDQNIKQKSNNSLFFVTSKELYSNKIKCFGCFYVFLQVLKKMGWIFTIMTWIAKTLLLQTGFI